MRKVIVVLFAAALLLLAQINVPPLKIQPPSAGGGAYVDLQEAYTNGTSRVRLVAPASLGGDISFTLPTADGTANQAVITSGAGALSFASFAGAGTCSSQFVRATVSGAGPTCATVGTADVATALKTGQIAYSFFDTSADLPATLDIPSIYPNRARAITITEVYCEVNSGGSATINLQRDDGSPSNILDSDLTCSSSGATSTTFTGPSISVGYNIDHVTVTAGSGLRRMNVAIKYTVD